MGSKAKTAERHNTGETMTTIKINDRIGSRNIHHRNLLVAPKQGIVEFQGDSISPVLRVVSKEYEKNGKWSHYTWTVEMSAGATILEWYQDWGTGAWFKARGLAGAVEELTAALPEGHGLNPTQVERAIRAIWPKTSSALAEEDAAFMSAGNQFGDLLDAQEEYASALAEAQEVVKVIEATEEAERLRRQAAQLKSAAAQAKGGKLSLADLKSMMAG